MFKNNNQRNQAIIAVLAGFAVFYMCANLNKRQSEQYQSSCKSCAK